MNTTNNKLNVNGVDIDWDLGNGSFKFLNISATLFWNDPSLLNMFKPLVDELGKEMFCLQVAYSSSLGTNEDYHSIITRFGQTFHEGFLNWGKAVSVAGWGIFELLSFDINNITAKVIIHNPWELVMQKSLKEDEQWGCPFLQGKIIGIFNHALSNTCWADAQYFIDGDDINVEFNIYSHANTIEDKIKILRKIKEHKKVRELKIAIQEYKYKLEENALLTKKILSILPDMTWVKDINGIYLSCNTAFERFFGAKESEIVGKTDYDFLDKELADFFRKHDNKAMDADKPTINEEWITYASSRHHALLETTKTPLKNIFGELIGIVGIGHDITKHHEAKIFTDKYTKILKMIATAVPAPKVYDEIALMYEKIHPGMRCSLLELKDGVLLHGGAPSMPKEYCNSIHGLKNGPNVGSCGTSTYFGYRVIVEDIDTDPKWAQIKHFALPHGMRSCWSEPIKNSSGKVLGAFGAYYDYPALPNDEESENLTSAARLASIVMERDQAIKQKHESDYELKTHAKYLQSIIDGVEDPIMVIKEDYTIEVMNESLKKSLHNLNLADQKNPKYYEVSHNRSTPCDGINHPCPLRDVLKTKQHTTSVHNHDTKDGKNRHVELSASPLFDKNQNCIGIIEVSRDITGYLTTQNELKEQKKILNHQAHHDVLTELPNRILFNDRLEQAIQTAKRNKTNFALLFIDLDHFKDINDSLGHHVGDEILKTVSNRLNKIVRNEDTIARLGGDEFTVILENLTQVQDASIIANKILDTLSKVIIIEDNALYISCSIGISIYPDDGVSTKNLLKFADSAMYKAKEEGRNNYQYYNSIMTELAFERVLMETSLREALKNEEFVVYYQPQINAVTNKLIGMEALVRWQHPTMGLVSPAKFIPIAESTGLIVELDRFVMKTAISQFSLWYKEGLNPGILAMNLTIKQLKKDDFIDTVKNLIKETSCKPEWLELEIAEGQIMTNPEEAIKTLQQISDIGIELAVDDFGTGYSSLAYLKRLPIHKLKIDLRNLPDDEEDSAIAKAVIALAHSLNLKVIAEGVETKEQRDFLVENGCENIQGFFYYKAVPAEKMEKIIRERNQ